MVRLPDLRVVAIGRHREVAGEVGASLAVPAFCRTETQSLLASLKNLEEVQAFLLENITGLMGREERILLGTAGVFRNRFTGDALAFVAERSRGEVQDTSARPVRYVATRSRRSDVAFFHTAVRDYVYARLGSERRSALHERAAMWFRRREEMEEAEHHAHQASEVGG